MHYILALISLILVYSSSFSQTNSKYSTEDVKALNALPVKWQHYWNMHNMDSMGTLLRNDVDFITVGGSWLKGKAQAVNYHKTIHQNVKFKTSTLQTDSVAIIYVKPDLAIMHIGTGISGDFENDGTPRLPRHIIGTWVVVKQHNIWLLHTVQNTNIK